MDPVICQYCGKEAELVGGDKVYGGNEKYNNISVWSCEDCEAWVGCHPPNMRYGRTGIEPLGKLAKKELREARRLVHGVFDPMWKEGVYSVPYGRKSAYAELAKRLDISVDECHIAMFDVEMCQKALDAVREMIRDSDTWGLFEE